MSQPSPPGSTPATQGQPWTRPDKINLVGVILALAAFIGGVGIPGAIHVYQHYFQEPRATIDAPRNGQAFAANRIAVKGTASNIPANSDLWLSASGLSDEVYPIAELQVNKGHWSASAKQACHRIGPKLQRIDVWISPDTSDGKFVAYVQKNNTFGFFSVPAGFVKLYQTTIHVRLALQNC